MLAGDTGVITALKPRSHSLSDIPSASGSDQQVGCDVSEISTLYLIGTNVCVQCVLLFPISWCASMLIMLLWICGKS